MRSLLSLFLLVTLLLSGCAEIAPCGFDKDQYLDNFKSFMEKAEQMDLKSEEAAWKKMDERFETLTEECMDEWEADMSLGEKAKVAGWVLKYNYIRYGKPLFQ